MLKVGQQASERLGKAEHERSAHSTDRVPFTQNHCRKGDVTITGRNIVGEGQTRTDGEECATQPSKTRCEDCIEGSRAIDVDTHGIGGSRVLTTGAKAQAPTRTVEVKRQENHRGVHQVHQDIVVEEHGTKDRDLT